MIQTESLELQTTQYDGRSFGNDLSGASTADRGADRVREPLREYSKSQLVRRNDQSRYLDKYVMLFLVYSLYTDNLTAACGQE